MRLTLRTLLAYMDDILDPADHEELGRKIESSDFATELIHRTRDAVRRQKLGAPEVDAGDNDEVLGGEPNLDANAVAEYLDNTMSPEQVAVFERQALEMGNDADMRLAEVASCHHILTMVLGEPADVPPDVRQRMYELKERAEQLLAGSASDPIGEKLRIEPGHAPPEVQTAASAPPVAPAVVAPAASAAPPVAAIRDEPSDSKTVPDYLQAAVDVERRSRNRKLAVAALLVLGTASAYLFWPQEEPQDPGAVADMGGSELLEEGIEIDEPEMSETPAAGTGTGTGEAPEGPPAPFVPGVASDGPPPPFVPGVKPAESGGGETAIAAESESVDGEDVIVTEDEPSEDGFDITPEETVPMEETAGAETGEPAVRVDGNGDIVGLDPLDVPDFEEEPEEEAATGGGPDGQAMTRAEGSGGTPPPVPTPPTTAEAESSETASGSTGEVAMTDGTPAEVGTAESQDIDEERAVPDVPAGPVQIGNYLGNKDVLLRWDAGDAVWRRLPNRSALATHEKILVLPKFRAHAVLAGGVNAYLGGGTEVTLLPVVPGDSDATDVALDLVYGRLLLVSGLEGNQIALTTGNETRVLDLGPSTTLAVESRRLFVPGSDLESLGPLELSWYLTGGSVKWDGREATGDGTWSTLQGVDSAVKPMEDFPEWVDEEPVTALERRAAEIVADALTPAQPVNIRLLELADTRQLGRRSEVRSLAVESGAYVGVFEPFVKSLNDEKQRANWDLLIRTMREAISRDPQAADSLYEDFTKQRGNREAQDLMEMLLGYDQSAIGSTTEQRKEGALPQLIRRLDSDQLDYRVLALHNLNEITGKKNLGGYRPERTASQRRSAVARYWQDLEDGSLKPRK
ncbi:hypothetical protein [Adhaeretor mobilis]|uniref:Uncharacterized protein n=1 Tax=Adhaeretor mobilis TaxID=1930276 RepID=A0A517N2S7_9BACT|nr:hypothetical protein [Adhaeretor mobilis]QDT01437.1 hypothetical protein HG15A2_47790 [Adhaeretor mobilis]